MEEKRNVPVSVIVPVYNVGKKLIHCIKSIMNQSFSDIEIILVDDGSTDDSGKMCDEFAKKDMRIRVFHYENGGLFLARKRGLSAARGEYISYVDADDVIDKRYIEKLYDACREGADISFATSYRLFRSMVLYRKKTDVINREFTVSADVFMKDYYVYWFGVCGLPVDLISKMIKKGILEAAYNEIGQYNYFNSEDKITTLHAVPLANAISFVPAAKYYYRLGGGTVANYKKSQIDAAVFMYNHRLPLLEKYNLQDSEVFLHAELCNVVMANLKSAHLFYGKDLKTVRELTEEFFAIEAVQKAAKHTLLERPDDRHASLIANGDIDGCMMYLKPTLKEKIKHKARVFLFSHA